MRRLILFKRSQLLSGALRIFGDLGVTPVSSKMHRALT
jgi:hypothetical protein